MVVPRNRGPVQHQAFSDLPDFLRAGDVLVFNDSRVIPARLHGRRTGTGGRVELLLLSRQAPGTWRALVRPGRRMRAGTTFEILGEGDSAAITGEVVAEEPDGTRLVQLSSEESLRSIASVALPPYIHAPLTDPERYQTVYARVEGSVAAPTAGLHFTPELLDLVRSMGVETAFVTLHVGWDSFRPVKSDDPSSHEMHSEFYEIGQEAAGAINRAKADGRRVICIGTTAVRLLEQVAALDGAILTARAGWAKLFILPGFRFRVVDALLTNFHLPRSTLLMLTCAFAGRERVLSAYHKAIDRRYRFYSFGDCMLIV
jgi:S-adenosylmethionine:tRNA ribosyltransferase-isomerase